MSLCTFRRLAVLSVLALVATFILPGTARAQAFGIGPRLSFVRGDAGAETPTTRFNGFFMRLMSSPHIGIEAALDRRSQTSEDGLARFRQTPIQGSILIVIVRSTLSPYLLGGIGMYPEFHDTLDADGAVVSTGANRKTGWHFGFGSEIKFVRHFSAFADYRYLFVKFGQPDGTGNESINLPGLKDVGITHQGSMWTTGAILYF